MTACIYIACMCTHPNSTDRLQVLCDAVQLRRTASCGTVEGTMRVRCSYCDRVIPFM